jgi:hypothetical protein
MALIESRSGENVLVFDDRPNARQRYKLNGEPVVGVTTFLDAGMPTPEPLINWKIGKASEYVWSEIAYSDETPGSEWFPKDSVFPAKDKDRADILKAARTAWKKDTAEAAGIGSIVHDYAHLSSLGRNDEAIEALSDHVGTPEWNQIQNAVYKVDQFLAQTKDEIILLETMVASPRYRFAGRLDRLVKRDGKIIITDYKTSKGFYLKNFVQEAAYAIALEEWLGIQVQGYEVIRFGKEGGDFEQLLITDWDELEEFRQAALRCLDNYRFLSRWGRDSRFKRK